MLSILENIDFLTKLKHELLNSSELNIKDYENKNFNFQMAKSALHRKLSSTGDLNPELQIISIKKRVRKK